MVESLGVSYTRTMDGIPVDGSVGVEVSHGPTVTCVINRLRQVVPDGKVAILSPQEAFDRLRNGDGHLGIGDPKGDVMSVKLVYWTAAPARDLPYIMPVYIFGGESVVGKRTKPWKVCVEAVRPEFLEMTPGRE